MKTLVEYINKATNSGIILNEASIKRLEAHLAKNEPIAIVSAEREDWDEKNDENNRAMNNRYTKELRMLVLGQKFGFNRVRGGFVETNAKDSSKKVEKDSEKSTLIFCTPEREEELKKMAIALGKKYKQDSILFVDSKGNACFIDTRDNVGKVTPLGKYTSRVLGKFYTKIKGRKFAFEPVVEVVEPIESFSEFSEITNIPTTVQMRRMDNYFEGLADKSLEETVELVCNFKF